MLEPASALLKKSWERSRMNGVSAVTAKDAILEEAQFRQYREQKEELLREINPTMEHLAYWLKSSYSVVVICDTSGYILESKGDPSFLKDTEKIQVHRGACWSEQVRGTNSAGTVIVEKKPLAVVGMEHYLEANHMLYCAASPIFDPYGQLLAVLDFSGHSERYHPSLLGMVDAMARKIEDWLLIHRPDRQMVISLSPEQNGSHRALLAVNQDGVVMGGNREAQVLMNLESQLGSIHITDLLTDIDHLLHRPIGAVGSDTVRLHSRESEQSSWLASVLIDTRPALTSLPPRPKPKTRQPRIDGTSLASFDDIYGNDEKFQQAIRLAKRAAATDYTIMLTGESGTGKDIVSQAIHLSSARASKPFVAINCGAIPKSLLESELFGYEAGAFTGAKQSGQPGKLEQAHEGTLFLDEIAEMPAEMQVALLRVLQDLSITRIGGTKSIRVDVRIITATHTDLWKKVQDGSFRADLFYRLQGVHITLPPFRERSDRLALARLLLKGIETELNQGPLMLTPPAERLVESYPWPGNVRQAVAALREAAFLSEKGSVDLSCFPPYILAGYEQGEAAASALQEIENHAIIDMLKKTGGNVSQTARNLGIGRSTVYRKIKKISEPGL